MPEPTRLANNWDFFDIAYSRMSALKADGVLYCYHHHHIIDSLDTSAGNGYPLRSSSSN